MSEVAPEFLDLPAYLRRVEYDGERGPSPAVLEALHRAHATHIPFENLDIFLGRRIELDLASLQAKLVAGRRGGYCFEQNLLFASVLQAFGFAVTLLAARVRRGSGVPLPRTHMMLEVEASGRNWLADVGFGSDGLLSPVPLGRGEVSRQQGWDFRVVDEGEYRVLQCARGGAWEDLYAFTREPQLRVDYELASHYTSTHPSSRFTQIATAQRIAADARYTLRGRDYSEDRSGDVTRRTLVDEDEVLDVLAGTFGLRFPPGTRFRSPSSTFSGNPQR